MTDIEFYLYTSSHKDIITYPRNSEAGQCFFHSSGVDISFESNVDTKVMKRTQKKKSMPHRYICLWRYSHSRYSISKK